MEQRVKWLLECIRMHAATHLMISPFNRHTQTHFAAFSDIPHVWAPRLSICLFQSKNYNWFCLKGVREERMQIAFRFGSSQIDSIEYGYGARKAGRAGKGTDLQCKGLLCAWFIERLVADSETRCTAQPDVLIESTQSFATTESVVLSAMMRELKRQQKAARTKELYELWKKGKLVRRT